MAYDLKTVDLIRERMAVGYVAAQEALEASGGDVVAALAYLEKQQGEAGQELGKLVQEIIEEVTESYKKRRIETIRIRIKDQVVAEVALGVGGVEAAALTLIAAVVENLSIEFEYSSGDEGTGELATTTSTSMAGAEVTHG